MKRLTFIISMLFLLSLVSCSPKKNPEPITPLTFCGVDIIPNMDDLGLKSHGFGVYEDESGGVVYDGEFCGKDMQVYIFESGRGIVYQYDLNTTGLILVKSDSIEYYKYKFSRNFCVDMKKPVKVVETENNTMYVYHGATDKTYSDIVMKINKTCEGDTLIYLVTQGGKKLNFINY